MATLSSGVNISLPSDKELTATLEDLLAKINEQSRAQKSPLQFSPFSWYEKYKTQIVLLSPLKEKTAIPVQEFSNIGKLQIELLKRANMKNLPIKISYIADASTAKLDHQSLNPANYDSIAEQLINQPLFDKQFMVLKNPLLEVGLKSGVFLLSQVNNEYKDHFYVFDSIDDTIHKLKTLYK